MANEVISQEGTATKQLSEAELEAALTSALSKGTELQAKEASEDGVTASYITLAKPASKALKPKNDLYIEGLKIDDFYIQKDKINLGASIKVVPLAFITVYNEKDKEGLDAKFLGVWNKEQAMEFPLVEGSWYDRQLPNGHILSPSNWVLVSIMGHPEIENAIVTYKSTGSRIFKAWKEDAKKHSGTCATLVYELSSMDCSNDKNEWTDIGFTLVGNLIEMDKTMALKCVEESNNIREAYQNRTFIPNRVVATAKPALKEAKTVEAKAIEANLIEDSTDEENFDF